MLAFFAIFIGLQILTITSIFAGGGGSAVTIREGSCAYSHPHWIDDILPTGFPHDVYGDLTELALNYVEACCSARLLVTHCHDVLTRVLSHAATHGNVGRFPARDLSREGEQSGFTCAPSSGAAT